MKKVTTSLEIASTPFAIAFVADMFLAPASMALAHPACAKAYGAEMVILSASFIGRIFVAVVLGFLRIVHGLLLALYLCAAASRRKAADQE